MFRDGFARLFKPRAIRASGNASGASVAAATRILAEFAFGIEDTGTDKDGTIHAFARALEEGGGVLPGGLYALLRFLFSWRNVPFSNP
jgi:hypothetical protein